MPQQTDALLRALVTAQVDFLVIGGVAANLHGATLLTRDLDVMAPLSVENCERILKALSPFEPRFYQAAGKPRVDRTAHDLSAFRNLYFSTTIGIIDLLRDVPPLGRYQEVSARAEAVTLFGLACKVLGLDDLIEVKAHVGRPKDKFVEAELRAIRERRK